MADRKPFLLRIDAAVLEALQRWANDDLRSLNGQIEFVLRLSLRASGRLKQKVEQPDSSTNPGGNPSTGEKTPGDQP